MNILFLTLSRVESFQERSIYIDLLNCFRDHGHNVYVVTPIERREGIHTEFIDDAHGGILRVQTGNVKKVNLVEKGISTLLLEKQYGSAIDKYLRSFHFDLILYSTPPITLQKTIQKLKIKHQARTYLLLKDIFPQNAVDLGIFKKNGLIYRYFRRMEKKLYAVSDFIGCMSKANVDYLLRNNQEIENTNVEVCPNSIYVDDMKLNGQKEELYRKYNIPRDKRVFIYGGNLGKPQGVEFIIECLHSIRSMKKVFFLIVGSGTEFPKLEQYLKKNKSPNVCLLGQLPKKDYDKLLSLADVGLIFLDKRFTIPNFPSRLLSYMQMEKPVLAVTDENTDIGQVILEANMGDWCLAGDKEIFLQKVKNFCESAELEKMGKNGKEYLNSHYTVVHSYRIIMNHFIEVE